MSACVKCAAPPGRPCGCNARAAHDPVDHPTHYTSHPARCVCGAGIECIQITEHMNFNLGNCVKYLWRAGLKGSSIEDLRKSQWYVAREIERLERLERGASK